MRKQSKMSVADAVSYAYGEISSLAEEIREVVDKASGTNRENTGRIQTLGDTADTLENCQEPDIPESLQAIEISFYIAEKRKMSRGLRRDNAIEAMQAVIDAAWTYDEANPDSEDDISGFIDSLENDRSEAEGVEFPGMMG